MITDTRRRALYDACDILDALYQLGADRMNMRIYDYLLERAKRDKRGRFTKQELPIEENPWIARTRDHYIERRDNLLSR
jgi:hypothetical protein